MLIAEFPWQLQQLANRPAGLTEDCIFPLVYVCFKEPVWIELQGKQKWGRAIERLGKSDGKMIGDGQQGQSRHVGYFLKSGFQSLASKSIQ